jgi:hypothetical protein
LNDVQGRTPEGFLKEVMFDELIVAQFAGTFQGLVRKSYLKLQLFSRLVEIMLVPESMFDMSLAHGQTQITEPDQLVDLKLASALSRQAPQ